MGLVEATAVEEEGRLAMEDEEAIPHRWVMAIITRLRDIPLPPRCTRRSLTAAHIPRLATACLPKVRFAMRA